MSGFGHDRLPDNGMNATIMADLAAVMPVGHANPERYLLKDVPEDGRVNEFISKQDNTRTIAMPANGYDSRVHSLLSERGLPVFRYMRDVIGSSGEQMRLMAVPPGSQPLGGVLHLIGQNPNRYGVALREVGSIQGKLWKGGFGTLLPAGGSLLDRFAVAPMSEHGDSAKLLMVPPYNFDTAGVNLEQFFGRVGRELEASESFDGAGLTHLLEEVRIGVAQGYEAIPHS